MSTDATVRRQIPDSLQIGRNLIPCQLDSISLYIHIPFCTSRCRYCNFYFETGWSNKVLQGTLNTILQESAAFRSWLFPHTLPQVRTIYFGGGTPSIIPPVMLDTFLDQFRKIWLWPGMEALEIAFEANPETISWDLLEVLGRHQVNRLSLGVQSFSSDSLQLLGRRAAEADVERALTCIQKAKSQGIWHGKLNVDLICGIPGQSPESISKDLHRLFAYNPAHVSLYTLTVEPETPLQQLFDQGLRQPMEAEEIEAIWDIADKILEENGFHNYEISNYAKPGDESQHNLSYWQLNPYLGLGPGAVGTIPAMIHTEEKETKTIVRLTNPNALAYSRSSRPGWEHSVEELSPRDFLIDHFLTGLRVANGINLMKLDRIFHFQPGTLMNILSNLHSSWKTKGWIDSANQDESQLCLSRNGRFVLNIILAELMDAIDSASGLFQDFISPDWPLVE